jgi:hypothetical protein
MASRVQALASPDIMNGTAAILTAALVLLDGRPSVTGHELEAYRSAQACSLQGALGSRESAFLRLLEAAIAEEAMRAHGGPVLEAGDLEREAARLERETPAPLVVACIKERLGPDYLRVYVKPLWIESRFRTFLSHDPSVQARPRRLAREAFERIVHGSSFPDSAAQLGLAYSSATYSESKNEKFIRDHLAGRAIGVVQSEPVETEDELSVLRVLRNDGSRWSFEAVSARKDDQADWFQGLPKMKLSIADEPLRLFVRGLKGNPRLGAVTLLEN